MVFWSNTSAASRIKDVWFSKKLPHFIRSMPPEKPKLRMKGLSDPVRLTIDHLGPLCAFWTAHYCGDDWYLNAEPYWVETYLNDLGVLVYGMFDAENKLVATIVSVPFTPGVCEMTHGGVLSSGTMRVIEGLCISKSLRGSGLAGYLIGFIDTLTSWKQPTAHLWSRETAVAPFAYLNTALRSDTYAMLKTRMLGELNLEKRVEKFRWDAFVGFWKRSCREWVMNTGDLNMKSSIVATIPHSRSGHIDVWITRPNCVDGDPRVVVVVNTRRRAIPGDEPIMEVVWCGTIHERRLVPNRNVSDFRSVLESVGANYPNVLLFASSGLMGGGASAEWIRVGSPWTYGHSGVHSWYIYNYMPPAFGSCELYAIRDEI
jgi:hypothetical protein